MDHLLSLHQGRDKILRTGCYGSLLLSGFVSKRNSVRLEKLSNELSACRTVLRLLDDIPMLAYTYRYGFGGKEKDGALRKLGILSNIVNQMYFPVEHIAWLGEKNIINVKDCSKWWNLCTTLWTASLIVEIIRGILIMSKLKARKRNMMHKAVNSVSSAERERHVMELGALQRKTTTEVLVIIQHTSDLCNAVHWLPAGILWSGVLKPWQVGMFGTISSLIGLGMMLRWK